MKTRKIAKILGLGLAVALAFSLGAGIGLTPASADVHEWSTIHTPSWADNVILPGSDLRDMAVGGDNGDVIYVIATLACRTSDWCEEDDPTTGTALDDWGLFKSDDGGVTWSNITGNVYQASSLPPCDDEEFTRLAYVAVAPDDEDWVAVIGKSTDDGDFWVVASDDGGDNFTFAGAVEDVSADTYLDKVRDMAVSPEVDGIHDIAVAGRANGASQHASIFRLEAGQWLSAS